MKKFVIKVIIHSCIVWTLCCIFQYVIDTGLKKYNSGCYEVWNKIFSGKINADIIVLGSSRALVQIDPKIVEDNLALSCYNLGIAGGRFISQKAKWDSYIAYNKSPKIIIQNIDILFLEKEKNIYHKFQYLPYLDEPTISSNLQNIDANIWIENLIPLFKYNGYYSTVVLGLKSHFCCPVQTKINSYHGYSAIIKTWNQDFAIFKAKNKKVIYPDKDLNFGFQCLEDLILECKKKNIILILIQTPFQHEIFDYIPQKPRVDSTIKTLAEKYNIQYWDYSNDSLCYDKKYFNNSIHLNIFGAEIFTRQLAKDLCCYIKEDSVSNFRTIFAAK